MVHSMRHWGLGFIPGALLGMFGLFSLIGKSNWLGPAASLTGNVLAYILAFAGLIVIIDSFFEFSFHSGMGISTLIVGLIVFGLGLINVLHSFGAVSFTIPIPGVLYSILFVVEGIMLVIATFIMD